MEVLSNYCYTGNLLLQRRYRENHITKRSLVNQGQLPKYQVVGSHEPIIAPETFQAVQDERRRRESRHGKKQKDTVTPFYHKIVCTCCGEHYNRKTARGKKIWICRTYNTVGKSGCPDSKAIPEDALITVATEVLGLTEYDPDVFTERVETITASAGNSLSFHFYDGTEKAVLWKDRSRSESWTPEMRQKARETTLERRQQHA